MNAQKKGADSIETDVNIRESYKTAFPAWSQPFFSWLSGMPFNGQKPLTVMRAETLILLNLLKLEIGLGFLLMSVGR